MNKHELVRAVANNAGITIKDATVALDAVVEAITDGLKKGETIQISGFGVFEAKNKPAHKGINPKTQETIMIPAAKVPSFKFSKACKDEINK